MVSDPPWVDDGCYAAHVHDLFKELEDNEARRWALFVTLVYSCLHHPDIVSEVSR